MQWSSDPGCAPGRPSPRSGRDLPVSMQSTGPQAERCSPFGSLEFSRKFENASRVCNLGRVDLKVYIV